MRKHTYFVDFDYEGWPAPKSLESYFLTAEGRKRFIVDGNDSWGLGIWGVDGTEHLQPYKDRIDIDLTIQGNPELGVLLCYDKSGGGQGMSYYSKGDLTRLHEWVKSTHDDLLPVGLFIPWERAWQAVKEFIEREAALPTSIEWINATDLPPNTFPGPLLGPNVHLP
jgi:hypothetical protein